eukprot:10759612-Lingulodinium_polyedra.AAC.1
MPECINIQADLQIPIVPSIGGATQVRVGGDATGPDRCQDILKSHFGNAQEHHDSVRADRKSCQTPPVPRGH